MKLDSVLTVAIGDLDQGGKHLPDGRWLRFQDSVKDLLNDHGTVVAVTTGNGVGTDGVNEGDPEETAVFVTINITGIKLLRERLATLLRKFGQTSACFAFDGAHEPCFNTTTGERPVDFINHPVFAAMPDVAAHLQAQQDAPMFRAQDAGWQRKDAPAAIPAPQWDSTAMFQIVSSFMLEEVECLVEAARGTGQDVSMWDCECRECRRLVRQADLEMGETS